MGLFLSRSFSRAAHLFSFVSFFVRYESLFLRLRPEAVARRSCQGCGDQPLGLALTVPSTAAPSNAVGLGQQDDDQRGSPRSSADLSRHNLVFGGSKDPNHDTVMRIGAKLRSGGPILCYGVISHGVPPGHRHLEPSLATRHEWTGWAKTVGCLLRPPGHCAGRRMTPSGTTPSRTSRHRAIRSLRAKATIMVLRVPRAFSVRTRNHYAKALSFWNRRNRHAN